MQADEYLKHDMIGLAALIARKEVTPGEMLEAALSRMAEANPKVNAVVLDMSDQARREATGSFDGPLAGVPYLMKDHGAWVAGTPTMMSCKVFKDHVQPSDSALVTAMRRSGVVIFGKTNTPEMSNDATTESRMHGAARNPWDLGRTTGGSSGGSAAAVAAGIVPAAHGSDGGGSIRLPAACTGLFGLKPSRGRVSMAPNNEGPGGFVVSHALTRSVRDSALLLDIVGQPQVGDRYTPPRPERPFLEEVGRSPGALRIAFNTGAFNGGTISAECADAVRDVAHLCESLGHHLEEVSLTAEAEQAAVVLGVGNAAVIAAMLDAEAAYRSRPIDEDELEPLTYLTYQRGKGVSAIDYFNELKKCYAFGRRMAQFFTRHDLLLNATTGSTAVRIGELHGDTFDLKAYAKRVNEFIPNTKAANISGLPAMSVPLAWSASDLPIGIQFTGRPGDEATLFRLAGQLEQARPWAQRRPSQFS